MCEAEKEVDDATQLFPITSIAIRSSTRGRVLENKERKSGEKAKEKNIREEEIKKIFRKLKGAVRVAERKALKVLES